MNPATIRVCGAQEAEARLPELGALLADAVADGASVNFMAGFTPIAGEAFWRGQLPSLRSGERLLLVADVGGRIAGTVVLSLASQPNGPHRAELGKMLVHSAHRRQGFGRQLLGAAEQAAQRAGRTLLLLDTEAGSAGDALYAACGWTQYGLVPDHAYTPDGRLAGTACYLKVLGTHRQSGAAP